VVLLAVAGVASGRVRSSLGRGGLGSRLDEWQVAVSVIADDPLLGLGPEGYRIGFARNVGAGYVRHHGLAFQPDRAHSALLDVAAAGGLGAGAAYLGVLALVAAACWRAAASPDPWLAGLAAGVLGYGLQLLVLFPLSELDPLFWLSAGMVVGATAVTVRRARFLPVAGAAAAVTLPVLALLGGLEVVADRHLAAADLAAADRATELRPDSIRHWFVASRLALRGGTILDVDAALDRIEQGLERSPADPILRREHATLLTERALRGRLDADLAVAAATTARYLESAPNDPVLWRNQALVADASGEMAAARRAVAVAIELDPDDPVSQALAARL
jgi:hypothetical protein